MNNTQINATIKSALLFISSKAMIDPRTVAYRLSKLNDWQRSLILSFKDRGQGTGKLTEAQVFSKDRFGSIKQTHEETAGMSELISDGIIEITQGVTAGHNRYSLTPIGMVLYLALNDELEKVSDYKPSFDWSTLDDVTDPETLAARLDTLYKQGHTRPPTYLLDRFSNDGNYDWLSPELEDLYYDYINGNYTDDDQ